MGSASIARPSLQLVSSRRSPADILQELAMKSPKDFLALTTLAQGILQRLDKATKRDESTI